MGNCHKSGSVCIREMPIIATRPLLLILISHVMWFYFHDYPGTLKYVSVSVCLGDGFSQVSNMVNMSLLFKTASSTDLACHKSGSVVFKYVVCE